MLRRVRLACVFVGVLLAMAGQVHAGLDIRIDLANYVGTTAGNWNNIADLTGVTNDLIDFATGSGTGVAIDGTDSPWQNFYGDDDGSFPDQSWLIQPATMDGAGLSRGATGTFRVSGLADSTYQVEIVSARKTFDYQNSITVDGAYADRTYLGTAVDTPWGSTSDGLTPGNWLIWDDVIPNAGSISIVNVASLDTLGMINAIRIMETGEQPAPIPVPGAVVLGLIGSSAVVIGRRHKRNPAV